MGIGCVSVFGEVGLKAAWRAREDHDKKRPPTQVGSLMPFDTFISCVRRIWRCRQAVGRVRDGRLSGVGSLDRGQQFAQRRGFRRTQCPAR